MTTHDLKVQPAYFDALADGRKTWEVRVNDRGFKVGDELHLREWVDDASDTFPGRSGFSGRSLRRRVTYIAEISPLGLLAHGVVIMSVVPAG